MCRATFYSAAYVRKWQEIIRNSPNTTFYAYTRSYRVRSIERALRALARLPNLRLWYSADRCTGIPTNVPSGVRIAWMQEGSTVPDGADLIFRVRPLRKEASRRIGLTLVCPHDTAVGKATAINCGVCGICWKE